MASSVSTFANAAADQLDGVISLTEALLGLTRNASGPVEIGVEARRIAILLGSAARSDGKQLNVDDATALSALGATSAPRSGVRLAICESLLAAVDAHTNVQCTAIADAQSPTIRIKTEDASATAVASDIVAAAADSGITIRAEASALSISFPR